jgi:GTP-binding protein EngB required for normal cell division
MFELQATEENCGTDVVILVDGSGSISTSDFGVSKNIAQTIASRFPDNHVNQISVVQFSGTATVHCPLTTDRSKCFKAIDSMPRMGGGTDFIKGVETCLECFYMTSRPDNHRQLWVITDGAFDKPSQQIHTMKQNGIVMTVIGIGEIVKPSLTNVASFGRCFSVNNFDQAFQLVTAADNNIFKNNVAIQVEQLNLHSWVKFGENLKFTATIVNIGRQPIEKGTTIVIKKTSYTRRFVHRMSEKLDVDESLVFDATLACIIKNDRLKAVERIPSYLEFELVTNHEQGRPYIEYGRWSLEWRFFRYEFLDLREKVNILLFGHQGSGKSSFVNSLLSTFSTRIKSLAYVARDSASVTKHFDKYVLKSEQTQKLLVDFFDIPGFEQDQLYRGQELEMIIEGCMPLRTELISETGQPKRMEFMDIAKRRSDTHEEHNRRIHVVVMMTSIANAMNEDQMERIATFYDRIRKKNRDVVLVATHVDEFPDQHERNKLLQTLQEGTRFETVFPLRNYIGSDRCKNFELERDIVRILSYCVNKAEDFMEREDDGLIVDKMRAITFYSTDSNPSKTRAIPVVKISDDNDNDNE